MGGARERCRGYAVECIRESVRERERKRDCRRKVLYMRAVWSALIFRARCERRAGLTDRTVKVSLVFTISVYVNNVLNNLVKCC